ncbi:hypothetical protein [Sagittula sp. SSi028]|uniref:hypothetical protein n=1 Tax=Sagittula sp. SSi028 TaxID=3400636 RepID=UPI003AF56F3C
MLRAKIILMSLCFLTTAGCGGLNAVSRNDTGMAFAAGDVANPDQTILSQAHALNDMTAELVRRATVKGAVTGAAAGCGLALVADGGQCIAGAVLGGGLGAMVGNAMGRDQVANRVEIVKLSQVTPAIADAQKEMAQMNDGLSDYLDQQDQELATMRELRDSGMVASEDYDARVDHVRLLRADLAQSLSLSAEQARIAKTALQQAGAQGQTGLDWHIMSAETLEDEAVSARSRISLL